MPARSLPSIALNSAAIFDDIFFETASVTRPTPILLLLSFRLDLPQIEPTLSRWTTAIHSTFMTTQRGLPQIFFSLNNQRNFFLSRVHLIFLLPPKTLGKNEIAKNTLCIIIIKMIAFRILELTAHPQRLTFLNFFLLFRNIFLRPARRGPSSKVLQFSNPHLVRLLGKKLFQIRPSPPSPILSDPPRGIVYVNRGLHTRSTAHTKKSSLKNK